MPANKSKTKSNVSTKGLKTKAAVPVWMIAIMTLLVVVLGIVVIFTSFAHGNGNPGQTNAPGGIWCEWETGTLWCTRAANSYWDGTPFTYGIFGTQYVCPVGGAQTEECKFASLQGL